MTPYSEAKMIAMDQYSKYPKLLIEDIIKALYQSEFGCAHFVANEKAAAQYLKEELAKIESANHDGELIQPIGEHFARVNLHVIKKSGMSPDTLLKLFILTSRIRKESKDDFKIKLQCIVDLCEKGELPFKKDEAQMAINEYINAGMHAVHHSLQFNKEYYPAYRVISRDLCRYIPMFSKIDELMRKKDSVTVAIEGKCTSGKSTLAGHLSEIYDCNIFHMDSFFLQKHQRTQERLSQPGGNVDYERFKEEVLKRLIKGGEFSYRPYDCSTQKLAQPVEVMPKRLNIIEGVYSMHPELLDAYDLSVYLDIEYAKQLERLKNRNTPHMVDRFINEWIPLENMYFEKMEVKARCDLIIEADLNSK